MIGGHMMGDMGHSTCWLESMHEERKRRQRVCRYHFLK